MSAASVAVVVTSVLFGSLHVYEGAVLNTCLGAMYAVGALRPGNLRAVIVAHVLQDFLTFLPIMTKHLHGVR
jgi:membrane protease YdiL (CAAX protease family)